MEIDLLIALLKQDSPSGDEARLADWLTDWLAANLPDARIDRLGDSLIVRRGSKPTVALFAHIDTTGFTLAYEGRLVPIGSPAPSPGTPLRQAGVPAPGLWLVNEREDVWELESDSIATRASQPANLPGTRWVYAREPRISGDEIASPYLDNRAGVWASLQALRRCPEIAVAFTVGEEHSGQGAYVCGRYLYDRCGISQALISDITWDTRYVHCGDGVAISLRDRMVPRQRFLDRVLEIAQASGIPFQREIESSGGSDGAYLQRCGCPIDWVFVGAPEKDPHSDNERLSLADLRGMADMLVTLVNGLN